MNCDMITDKICFLQAFTMNINMHLTYPFLTLHTQIYVKTNLNERKSEFMTIAFFIV